MKIYKYLVLAVGLVLCAAVSIHFIRDLQRLTAKKPEVVVTIPDGVTVYDIDRILSAAKVIHRGDLINMAFSNATSSSPAPSQPLEGKLFPDTYDFFVESSVTSAVQKFLDNFNAKAKPLLDVDPKNAGRNLIIASIIQKEVPGFDDRATIAGILGKRLAANMPLDFDTTICYIKQQKNPLASGTCANLSQADFRIDSSYNTYLYRGLPPAPIGNPGIAAIMAALHPKSSPYWYYLSDPKTGKTIYAITLSEQEQNQREYLK